MCAIAAYPKQELHRLGAQRRFTGPRLAQIAFPLGGIGTGTVSLGGRGNLQDWEIHNHPHKGHELPLTFFAVWAKPEGRREKPVAKILERRLLPPYHASHGYPRGNLGGVARLDEAVFRGEYPFAWLDFRDRELPVRASLEAFTPFIPGDVEASSYPAAVFHWTFRNPTKKKMDVALLASMQNPIGRDSIGVPSEIQTLRNQYRHADGLRGLWFSAPGLPENDPNSMSAALATPWRNVDVQTNLYRGGWWDAAHLLWDDFSQDGRLAPRVASTFGEEEHSAGDPLRPGGFFEASSGRAGHGTGALCLRLKLAPGQSATIPVLIAWHSPYLKAWTDGTIVRTYMAAQFRDAWDVLARLHAEIESLTERTRSWHETFFSSTLPAHVLDAVSSQASIIRTGTCLRLADGQFYGWEGCRDQSGCCQGNCTHVWNYEQALAFLFPSLERSMRRNEFLNSTGPNGAMRFRSSMPANARARAFHPAADGQMGSIIRAYRDWQFSGDESFLKEIWPPLKRALEYAWTEPDGWDADRDGVMEGCQHNTYDIEFYGPNTMMGALYLGALEAAARMAAHLGEKAAAKTYRALAARGRARMEKELWNGRYYIQKVDVRKGLEVPGKLRGPVDFQACGGACDCAPPPGGQAPAPVPGKDFEVKYQYGEGCLSDQLLGQWACHVAGLGYVLDPRRAARALKSIYQNNFRRPIGAFSNVQRLYALNDEAGLLLCSWPKGRRPRLPFVYSDEVWTGIEYQVAAHLIYEGHLDEGLAIVKGVRERHDGVRRNPWDEFECGHHYARAMSSWSLLLALSGFRYSAPEGRIGFAPRIRAEDFRCAFTCASGWGRFVQKASASRLDARVELRHGQLELRCLELSPPKGAQGGKLRVTLDGQSLAATGAPEGLEGPQGARHAVRLAQPLLIEAGQTLRARLG